MKFLAICALGLASVQAMGQWTFGKATYKHAGPYTQAELDGVMGLHKGDKVSIESLQAAAQRLQDTGYFSDVGVGTAGSNAALELVLTLEVLPEARMTRVGFENFVWLTQEELQAVVHKAAPMFHGRLPDTGHDAEAIQKALTEALAAKGQQATVSYETIEPTTEQPLRATEFYVAKPRVVVSNVKLQGVSATMAPVVQGVAKKLTGSAYSAGLAGETTEGRLLAPYLDAGYLEAKLTGVQKNVAATASGAVGVEMVAAVEEGPVYHVASLEFAGTQVAPASLMAAPKLKAGDVASRKLLLEMLLPIDTAYRKLGYMDVVVDSGAVLDKSAHTVAYKVTVIPGEPYRVAELHVSGLDAAAQAEFDRGWQMREGALYNVEYVKNFLANNTALRALGKYTFAYRAEADPQKHTVVLTLKAH